MFAQGPRILERSRRHIRTRNITRKKRHGFRNIASDIVLSQITGEGYKNIMQWPHQYLYDHNRHHDAQNVPGRTTKLASLIFQYRRNATAGSQILALLRSFEKELYIFETRNTTPEQTALEQQEHIATAFYFYGTTQVLIEVLLIGCESLETIELTNEQLQMKVSVIEIMTKLFSCDASLRQRISSGRDSPSPLDSKPVCEFVLEEISKSDAVFYHLFELLAYKQTVHGATQLLEDIIPLRAPVLLAQINNLGSVIDKLDDLQMECLAGVLAVTMTDTYTVDSRLSLSEQIKRRKTPTVNVRDQNHEFIVESLPNLLCRVIHCLKQDDGLQRYLSCTDEMDNWIEYVDRIIEDLMTSEAMNALLLPGEGGSLTARPGEEDTGLSDNTTTNSGAGHSMAAAALVDNDGDSFRTVNRAVGPLENLDPNVRLAVLFASDNEHSLPTFQPSRQVTELLTRKINVLLLLAYCFSGKYKKKVQQDLAEMGLFEALTKMFKKFVWRGNSSDPDHRVQRTHDLCSAETAIKIQFLRLLHSVCDQLDHKSRLFSPPELIQIREINDQAPENFTDPLIESFQMSDCYSDSDSKGLLSQLIYVTTNEDPRSTYRFWLTRALESFLRCDRNFPYQTFMVRRGLVNHLLSVLMEERTNAGGGGQQVQPERLAVEIIQSTFDLLSELVKFNLEAFHTIQQFFHSNQDKFDEMIQLICGAPVDSNMFVRSILLTYEDLSSNRLGCAKVPEDEYMNMKLMVHIASFDQRLFYTRLFLTHVFPVETITQENVSCLNTALVIMMFCRMRNSLSQFLTALYEETGVPFCNQIGGDQVMKRLWHLLMFWQIHYLHKDKDCTSLERSSRIKFSYWNDTVNLLLSPENKSGTTIASYVSTSMLIDPTVDHLERTG